METKTKYCKQCDEVKAISDFYKDSKGKDGYYQLCKKCSSKNALDYQKKERKENPIKHYKKTFWTSINQRAVNGKYSKEASLLKNRQHQSYHSKGVLVAMSKEDFERWYDENSNIVLELVAQGKTPSIDRIDNIGDYEIGNIQIIDNLENKKKPRNRIKRCKDDVDFATWDAER